MSDRLAKQTFFVVLRWGMDLGGGVERNLNLLFACRSMYYRSKLILRWEKRFQFCEICHLDLFFFLVYSKLKISLVPLILVVVLFLRLSLLVILF